MDSIRAKGSTLEDPTMVACVLVPVFMYQRGQQCVFFASLTLASASVCEGRRRRLGPKTMSCSARAG